MFEADLQILLCIERFEAINAKYTHPYCMAFKISTIGKNGQVIQALPHSIISNDSDIGGSIDSTINCYVSPYMKIQPNSFTIPIKQLCSFKLNIEWKDNTNETQLLVECFLYVLNSSMALTPVGNQSFKLRKLTGRSTYLPLLFQGFQYTCYIDASIHTQLVGFKWKRPLQLQEDKNKDKKGREEINVQDKKPVYTTIGEYILGHTSMKPQLLTQISEKYINLLLGSIDRLQHFLTKIKNTAIFLKSPQLNPLKILDHNQWGNLFLQNLNDLSGYCYQLWNQYIKQRSLFPDMKILKQNYLSQLKYQFNKHIHYGLQLDKIEGIVEKNLINTTLIVGDLKFPRSVKIFVQNGDLYPIRSVKKDLKKSKAIEQKQQHLIVLVHGLAANRIAMQTLKNTILYLFPHLKVITSTANQFKTQQHIEEMGKRLAEEVRIFIQKQRLSDFKITFIAHSLGGLITRAALLHLESFKNHFQSFITLGTPHLGYLFHHSYIIKTGLWFLNKWKPSLSLSMLSFNDKQNLNQSYLYRLSMQNGFEWFKHVVLIANPMDSYVSQHSALIEFCSDALSDKQQKGQRGSLFCQIVENLQQKLQKTKVTRIIVHGLSCTKTGMDSLIGRTAHIEYLSDATFLKMFLLTHQNLFKQ